MYTVKAFVNGTEYVLHNPKQNLYIGDGYFEIGDIQTTIVQENL